MGLLSIFKRKAEADAGGATVAEAGDVVQKARTRARQRLIGAVVLVGIGIIGFPLVFETQPRPIPVDIPIEIPHKDTAPALAMPPARDVAAASPKPPAAPAPAERPTEEIITESPADAGKEVAAASATVVARATPTPAPAGAERAAPQAAERAASRSAARPTVATPMAAVAKPEEPKPADVADAARARALLDGKDPAKSDASRFIVQVGAFAEANAAHEARMKAEKLGLKTYTQVAQTASGSRIRVRVGPFASRDEADRALAKARSAGLSGVVLTL